MRAKILLLTDGEGESALAAAERALSDAAAAFGHAFVLMRGTLVPGAPDALVNACLAADAVFAADARAEGLDDLREALGEALRLRVFDVPRAVSESAARFCLATVESMDDETKDIAFEAAKAFSAREDMPVAHVAPGGRAREDWVFRAERAFAGARLLSAPDAATALVEAPASLGLLLAPPNTGAVLLAVATALAPYPVFLRDVCLGGDVALFAPLCDRAAPERAPWGALLAVADLMRDGLSLGREADCVEAAVRNVLAAGWRTADIAAPGQARVAADMICDLVSEQIELAGELLGKGESFHENPLS